MHIGRHIVQELVLQFRQPEVERWDVQLTEPEFRRYQAQRDKGRAHDVAIWIQDGGTVALVSQTGYPDGAFAVPLGAIHPEESFLDGAARAAREETGLLVRIEDYVLQIHASLDFQESAVKWTTHVMLARHVDGTIGPLEGAEASSARWVTFPELTERVNPILNSSGLGALHYCARMHERLAELTAPDREFGT